MTPRRYAEMLEAHIDEGGGFAENNIRDLIQMVKSLTDAMQEAHSALDRHLGDSYVDHFETDDEMREEAPDQWAAKRIAEALWS